jgi:hypothetical protein
MDFFVNPKAPIATSRYGEAFLDQHGRHVTTRHHTLTPPFFVVAAMLISRPESGFAQRLAQRCLLLRA